MTNLSKSASLREIEAQQNAILEQLDDIDLEDETQVALFNWQLEQVARKGAAKVDAVGQFVKRMEAHQAYHTELAKMHSDEARVTENFIKGLKAHFTFLYETNQLPAKLEGDAMELRFQRNSQPSVKCDVDQETLMAWMAEDPDLVDEVVTYSLNRKEVVRRFKMNEETTMPIDIVVSQGHHMRVNARKGK